LDNIIQICYISITTNTKLLLYNTSALIEAQLFGLKQ